jgi:cation-transporting ATPase 13A3/4/5
MYATLILKKEDIYCTNSKSILTAGSVSSAFFDKTGTITHYFRNAVGYYLQYSTLYSSVTSYDYFKIVESLRTIRKGDAVGNDILFSEAIACCHSLSKSSQDIEGDPLEIAMFKLSKWEISFDESDSIFNVTASIPSHSVAEAPYSIQVKAIYAFDNYIKRAGVVAYRMLSDSYIYYCKGDCASIKSICLPNTIPTEYDNIASAFISSGMSVISIAYKYTTGRPATRGSLESDLTFLGFICFQNIVKDSAISTIDELKSADIQCSLISGDNIWCSIKVGYKSHFLEQTDMIALCSLHESKLEWGMYYIGDLTSLMPAENIEGYSRH